MRNEKPRATGEFSDSSMSDIAFLLLIFFLVTTTFDVQKGISYQLPKKPDEQTEEVVIDETNRLVMTIKQWGIGSYVALIDQAPPDGPLQRARAGEDVALDDPVLQEGIMALAAQRAETVEATSARLLNNLEVAKGVPSGTYSTLNSAIQAENLTPIVHPGLIREIMGAGAPVTVDPNFGEVAFGDTLVLADARQGNIASAVRESELVVILKFFPDCDYDGMIAALDVIRRNGVSRTGITLQERLGGGV